MRQASPDRRQRNRQFRVAAGLGGYVAVTIADDQPPAVATVHAQQEADTPAAVNPDEISGFEVGPPE
jgi:hypothetical protein